MPIGNKDDHFVSILDEIDDAIDNINKKGGMFFEKGDYSKAKQLMEKGSQLRELREEVLALQNRISLIIEDAIEKKPKITKKRRVKKINKGLRTHEDKYRVPILQALVELGGSSNLHPVIDRVGNIMKPILNEYDYMPLKSDPKTPKWRNTTQWVRFTLVQEGWMADDSPVGIWEITPKGRQWLDSQLEK